MKCTTLIAAFVLLLCGAGDAAAKTWVVPHVFDTSGSASSGESDTFIYFTHNGGIAGIAGTVDVTADLYLFDDTGQPVMDGTGSILCGPCSFNMSTSNRTAVASIHEILTAANAFPPSGVFVGFAIVVVEGADAEAVGIQQFIANFQNGPTDMNVFVFEPQPIAAVAAAASATASPTFSYVHAIQTNQSVGTAGAFNTFMHIVYGGGRGPVPAGSGATVDVYLYDEATSLPVQGINGDVCNPCSFPLGVASPKATLSLYDAFITAGGFVNPLHTMHIVVSISGDHDLVGMSCQVVNSDSPAVFDMWPLFSNHHPTGPASAAGPGALLPPGLRSYPNPFNPTTTFEYQVVEDGPVRIDVVDVRGHIVATLSESWQPAGTYTAEWDGRDDHGGELASGVYFARMSSNAGTRTLKLTLLK